MLKLGRVTKVKVLFLLLVFVFNFDLFKFSAAILEKGLFKMHHFPNEELKSEIDITPPMPNENRNSGGSFVLDLRT